jgi:hypothetical protein
VIVHVDCALDCGEHHVLYAAPGAMHRCWKCGGKTRILGDEYEVHVRQEWHLPLAAPGHVVKMAFAEVSP